MSEPLSLLHCRDGLLGSAFRPSGHGVERAERDFSADPVTLLKGGAHGWLRQRPEQGFDLRRPPGKPQQRQDYRLPPRIGTELRDQAALLASGRRVICAAARCSCIDRWKNRTSRRRSVPAGRTPPRRSPRCSEPSARRSLRQPETGFLGRAEHMPDIPGGKAVFDIAAGMIELQVISQVGQYLPDLIRREQRRVVRMLPGAARPG